MMYHSVNKYVYFGAVNKIVKEYIKEHLEEMKSKGMKNVFIKEIDILPAVILTLRNDYEDVDMYWNKVREELRKCGAEYVSNIYENEDDNDIDEDYKLFI